MVICASSDNVGNVVTGYKEMKPSCRLVAFMTLSCKVLFLIKILSRALVSAELLCLCNMLKTWLSSLLITVSNKCDMLLLEAQTVYVLWIKLFTVQDLVIILEAIRIISVALSPVAPRLCWRIYSQLNYSMEQFLMLNWVMFLLYAVIFYLGNWKITRGP